MILAGLGDIITKPFGWILLKLYELFGSYGLAIILFAVIVQLVLLPITAKSKKGMMKMSRLQPRVQALQKKYANDQMKLNAELQALYKSENASMTGGCLWSLVPMLILIPLYSVIRYPLQYIVGASPEIIEAMGKVVGTDGAYWQVDAALQLFEHPEKFAHIDGIAALQGIDFNFFGLNLGLQPEWQVWTKGWKWEWIGLALIPIISAASQILQTMISRKMNNSVITNEKGVQDKETAEKSQSNSTMKAMMWMMPLMSLFIGFGVPAGLSIYWFVGGVVRTIEDVILTNHYRKVYDAEDAIRLQKAMELEAIEAEKERIRAERRAANPDGITSNTSKKKLQQKQREEQQAAKAAAAKEYAAKKGIVIEEEKKPQALSGVADRPYCKGRAYQADRYSSKNTEE
ncbi:MAG: YidC/Oxa1 family membrane protein insertase [Ruminococcaceae bacterium]|nr:YidC/Oxa1 family membrane protein insertase [Oscillospiraceae bacterium]